MKWCSLVYFASLVSLCADYKYDSLNRLIEYTAGEVRITYTYDKASNVTSVAYSGGAGDFNTVYNTWISTVFSSAEQSEPLISGQDADPDGDGLPNWAECSFGLDPKLKDRTGIATLGVPAKVSEESFLVIEYSRLKSPPPGIQYQVVYSADLNEEDWQAVDGVVVNVVDKPGLESTHETVSVRDDTPINVSEGIRFLRVILTKN